MNTTRDSLIMTISKGVRALGLLLFTMIAARILSYNDFGTYKQMLLISNLIFVVLPFGIPTTISYYYNNLNEDKKDNLISNTLMILFFLSFIAVIIILLFQNNIADFFNNSLIREYIFPLSLYIFMMVFGSFLDNLLISSGKTVILGNFSVIYYSIYYTVLAILTYYLKDISLVFYTMFIMEFIRFIILMVIYKRGINFTFRPSITFLKEQLVFSLPLGLGLLVQTLNIYVDKMFISNLYSPEDYAIYANGAMDIPFVGIITVSFATVILPILSKTYNSNNDFKGVISIWEDSIIKTAAFIFPVFFILLTNSLGYISLIFSEKYLESNGVFLIYLLKLPLSITIFGNILIVLGKQKYILYNMTIGFVLNVILNFLFIKIFGIKGPAISTALIHLLLIILQLIQISKHSKTKFSELLPFKKLLILFTIPLIPTFITALIKIKLDFGYVVNLFLYGSFIFIFCLLLYIKFNYLNLKKIKGGRIK